MSIKIITKNSPNFSSRKNRIPDIIVCHQTAGTSVSSALNWFADPKSGTSSNFIVDINGTIYCCVPIDKMAWCNGNKSSILDRGASNHYTKSLNPIVKSRAYNANLYTVSIEFVHKGKGDISAQQKSAGLALMKYIKSELKRLYNHDFKADREHIIGHYEISPVNKSGCPGILFPYQYFIDNLSDVKKELAVGDEVEYNGLVYTDSYGNPSSAKGLRKGKGILAKIIPNRSAGYLVDKIGWFYKSNLK